MPGALPDGDPVPADGKLPAPALDGLGPRPFGFYVHVPFCMTRCGYCDFNTYTAAELGGGASRAAYAGPGGRRDPAWPAACSATADVPVSSVFFGGGTPTAAAAGAPW